MWDEEDEKLMCKALGYHGDDVCPECGYETCHCDDIYEMSLRSYKCVCKKCGKEFIITSQGQPSVNFCDDCHYEAITVCKKCGKEVNVNIISASRESHVENSTYVCEECQSNIPPKGFLVTCEEWNLCSTEELAEKKLNHEKYYCPKCHSVNCRCADIEYAKETQECCEKDAYFEKKCEKCGSVFFDNIYNEPLTNLCSKCRYETITICSECGKEFKIYVLSTSDEYYIKESICTCPECEEKKRKLEHEKFCKEYFERTGKKYEENYL
mgnify:FL=1